MEIRVPEVGESVHEALLAKWFKKTGEVVKKDEPLCEIETDKITMDIHSDAAGQLTITASEGQTVRIGAVIGSISEVGNVAESSTAPTDVVTSEHGEEGNLTVVSSPAVRQEMRDKGIDPGTVTGTGKGGRITLDDLFSRIEERARRSETETQENTRVKPTAAPVDAGVKPTVAAVDIPPQSQPAVTAQPSAFAPESQPQSLYSVHTEEAPKYSSRAEERKPMSPIRKRIAERLLSVRQQTAMLTTFNEADLSHIKALRQKYREHFQNRHGIALGFMPFFIKACIEALRQFPMVNASIDGDDLVIHNFYDIGIAIGSEKGLVVPILRDADRLRLYEIELAIADFAEKIKTNRLAIADLQGGTFTISNGGVYGSLLSTPILNPPQSAVLGMHAIQDRPVVRDGQIVIRPMMYLALSYDHRIIDGREAVGFLKKIKEYIEDPEELLLEG